MEVELPRMPQRDFVLRWIEEIVRTVHRMLFGPGPVDLAMAESRVDDAIAHLLGPLTLLIPRLDVPSAADLLGDSDRIMGLAELLDLKAAVLEAQGNPAAEATRERAAAFKREVARREA
jgi:hypothetical protein